MKKILYGFIGLFLVIGIVAGTAYALFTSQATVTGMVLGTSTPGLKVSFMNKTNATPTGYYSSIDFLGWGHTFAPLLPGEEDWGAFFLKNDSTGTTDPLHFKLKGSITAAQGDWNILKDVIQMKICVFDQTQDNSCNTGHQTNYMTLSEWNTTGGDLPGTDLLQGTERAYVVVFYIHPSHGNSISGKTITDMTMQVIGTQVE